VKESLCRRQKRKPRCVSERLVLQPPARFNAPGAGFPTCGSVLAPRQRLGSERVERTSNSKHASTTDKLKRLQRVRAKRLRYETTDTGTNFGGVRCPQRPVRIRVHSQIFRPRHYQNSDPLPVGQALVAAPGCSLGIATIFSRDLIRAQPPVRSPGAVSTLLLLQSLPPQPAAPPMRRLTQPFSRVLCSG